MSNWKSAALVCAIAMSAFGGWLFYRAASPRSPRHHIAAESDTAQLEKEIAALRVESGAGSNELASLRAELAALKARQQPGAQAPAAPRAAQQADGAPTFPVGIKERVKYEREKNAEIADRVGTKLDGLIRAEAIDRSWSQEATESIEHIFSAIPNSHIEQTDCRAHLCRIVIEHDSSEEQESFGRKIVGAGPFDQDTFFRYDWGASPPKTIVYVSREGSHLTELAGS